MSAEPASPVPSRRAERRRLLADVSIFASLSEDDLDRLVDVTAVRRIERGETLFRKGDPGHQLYGVLSGRLKILVSGPDGKEIVFTVSEAGDVIGDIALLDSNPRSASVVAWCTAFSSPASSFVSC